MIRRSKATAAGVMAVVVGLALVAPSGPVEAAKKTTPKKKATTKKAAPATKATATTVAAPPAEDAGLAAAKAELAKWATPVNKIGPTVALKSKPPKKTIYWLPSEAASSTAITPGLKDATALLGWDLKVGEAKAFEPAQAFQAAIDSKADYIAISGSPYATYKTQAEEAQKKGIKVISCYAAGPENAPSPSRNLLNQCGDENFVQKTGPAMADWMIVDSKSAANVLIVNIPDYPVLAIEETAFKAELKKNCAKCSADSLPVTLDDLIAGKVPNAVASKIQQNSKLNYVFFTFGDLPGGVTATLKSAGLLSKVKVFGQDFNKGDLEEIVAGTMGAWSTDPKAYAGWLMVDAAARDSIGQANTEERDVAALPFYIVSTPEEAKKVLALPGNDWNPADMAGQFKKIWGV
jgi:ABC-type sugar transport system substrate-binding protein